MLSTLRLGIRKIYEATFNAGTSGNTVANQFLNTQANTSAPATSEATGQTPAGIAHELWRLQAEFTLAGLQQATLTARINGVSQASTATTIGTGTTVVTTDLATPIQVNTTDMLSILYVTGVADATATRPRCVLVGAARSSL